MSKKIILLIPYYGSWPEYIQIYNATCKNNPLLDICFITDLKPFHNPSENIFFYSLSFPDLKKRIETVFNIDIARHTPYKLCDFRPAYSIIFSDLVRNYDFWGYGDIDLIYGNLTSFITEDVLKENDIIAFRPDHLHGPFTLYRNCDYINNLFRRSENFNDIFTDPEYRSFDEFGLRNFIVYPAASLSDQPNDTISVIALKEANSKKIKLHMTLKSKEKISDTNDIVKYSKGQVTDIYSQESYAFYHWVIEKRAAYFKYPKWNIVPDTYYISSTGFYSDKQFSFYFIINFCRKLNGILFWYYLRFKNYPLRRMGKKIKIDTYSKPGFVKQ